MDGKNSDSIYGFWRCRHGKAGVWKNNKTGQRIYLHITEPVIGPIPFKGIKKGEIAQIRLLYDGVELKLSNAWVTTDYKDQYLFFYYAEQEVFTVPLPDSRDTVVEITLK